MYLFWCCRRYSSRVPFCAVLGLEAHLHQSHHCQSHPGNDFLLQPVHLAGWTVDSDGCVCP